MKIFSNWAFIIIAGLLYINTVKAQTADPIRYSMQTTASLVGLGEELEIEIKAERIKYPSKTVFIFKEDYSVQLKVIVPNGFIQTGGTYSPNTSITFSPSVNEVVYTLKGKFVEYTGQTQFMLLKRNQSTKEQGVYVAAARLSYSVSEPNPANQLRESATLALNSPGYVPYMTVDQLRSNTTDLEYVVNIISNNRVWTYQYDSTSSATDDGATVLVQNSNNRRYLINTDVISPALFGAKGDGVADDTSPVNLALAFAKTTKRAVSGENKQYKITNTVKVDAVMLKEGTFLLESAQANIRLSGNAPEIRDCNILANVAPSSLYGQYGGAINLHLSTGAIIHNVAVTAKSIVRRIAISCISRATNTMVDGLIANTAWGVLFNDLIAPGSTDRIVDGLAYGDATIGSGLTIQNSHFYGHVNNTMSGDAIEINVPNFRFSDIQITNNRIYKTTTSDNVGIGIGLANVDNAVVAFNKLTNVGSVAGALHCEWSNNVQFVGNTVTDSEVGGSFTTSQNVIVRDNYFQASKQFGIKSQNTSSTKMLGLDIINNTFTQGKGNDIIVGNIERLTIQKNRFLGMGADSLTHLNFVHYGPDSAGARNVKVLDNDFVNNNRPNISIASVRPNCFEWQSKGNNFSNYGNTVQSFMSLVSARGICEDFYRASTPVDQVKGSIYKVNGTPNGYITGSPNRIAEDLSGGVRYRYDATSSVWSIPGESVSNPLNLGSAYIWKGTDGQPRFKTSTGGPLTIDTSAGLIPVKVQSPPASSTSPGKPGNFYSDSSFLYIYTGDGFTHSWARVAVSSW